MTLEQTTQTRLFVLQRAILALINTHPDPRAFARVMGSFTAVQQIDQIEYAKSNPEVRAESDAFAREIIDFAGLVAEKRDSADGKNGPSGEE
ncbi:hypothetical protein LJR130_001054 [Variovorax sp. LjRoot130]|uniref:hypothetical protein n=1 Tax=Variovorax sp. LjRoot130 TaxID=3342261 RepID=UPI003ECF83D0